MSTKSMKLSTVGFLVATWISVVVCMGTTMNEKANVVAKLMPVKLAAPKELREDVLLSQDDFAEDAPLVDPSSTCEGQMCNVVEADVTLQTAVKASASLLDQLPSADAGGLQGQSLLALASECFLYCQDILLFGLAIGSLYVWRYIRASQVGDSSTKTEVPESAVNRNTTVASRKAESALNVDALVKAMYSENKEDLRKMLDERSVNSCDDACCCTALHVAAHYKCVEAAEALLERGANADVKDVWDETPLHFAARVGHTEICALLLKKGAHINAANAQGYTPLLVAAEAGMEETCEFLLDHGAHVGGIDEDELPALLSRLLQCRILCGI